MADSFTPEQIEQFLQEFFTVVGRRQYIGARYVPVFGRRGESSIEWDNSAPYEPLTIVVHQGISYTSRTYVPTGIDINNTEYWAETGNYNAQVEQYRVEVLNYSEEVQTYLTNIHNIEDAMPISSFDSENTIEDGMATLSNDIKYKRSAQDYVVASDNFTLIHDFSLNESSYIYSGMTYDDGYIYLIRYANTSSHSHLLKINISNMVIVNDLDLGAYYHGNSVFMYNGNIYVTGSASYIVVSTAMSIVKTVSIATHISTFIPNGDYALGLSAGNNICGIYRKSNGMYSKIGVNDTIDFGLSGLQDGCVAYGLFCSLQGHVMLNYPSEEYMRSLIAMRAYNGKSVFNLILPNIEQECEGISFADNTFYILTVFGQLYAVTMPYDFSEIPTLSFYANAANSLQACTYTPNVYERSSECVSDNGWVTVQYNNVNYKIHRFIYVPKAFDTDSCPYMNNFLIQLATMRNKLIDFSSFQTGEDPYIDLRAIYYGTSMSNVVCWWMAYRKQANDNGVFLAAISARNLVTNTVHSQTFGENDTDSDFATKVGNMLAWAADVNSGYNIGNEIGRIGGIRTSMPQYVKL